MAVVITEALMKRPLLSIFAALALLAAPAVALSDVYIHATGGLKPYRSDGGCKTYSATVYRCDKGGGVTFRPSWESKPCHDMRSSCCHFVVINDGGTFFPDKWSVELGNPRGTNYNCTYNWRGRPNTVEISPPR